MQVTRSTVLSMTLAASFLLLPGCRTQSDYGNGSPSIVPSLSSKEAAESSARRVEAQARYATGLSLDLNQQPEKALAEYVLALRAEPSNEQLAVEISRRLVLAKQLERALEVVELAASANKDSATLFAQLGVLYAELDRFPEAEEANRKAIELAPDVLVSYYNLYALFLKQNETEKAVAVLNEAAQQESDSSEFWLDLAEVYANFSRNQTTEKDVVLEQMKICLKRADELGVQGGTRRLKLADGYALAGESDKAVAILLELLEYYKDRPNRRNAVQQKLLSLYISNQDTDGAIAQLESIVRDHPMNPQANYLLASFALEKEDNAKAIDYFQKTIQLQANFEQAYYSLAGLYLSSLRPADAAALLETARHRFKSNFVLEYYSAIAYSQLEAHDAAVEHYTNAEIISKASNSSNLNHRFYFGFGAQLERLKLFERAAEAFQKSLDLNRTAESFQESSELQSDLAQTMNYLGYMWAEQGINLEQARDYIQEAVDLDPENPAFLDSLAWVLYKMDQPNLALVHMEDAIKFHAEEEPDAVLFDHLADIQFAIGNIEKAREAWEKSLQITDDPAVKEKLEDLLNTNPGIEQ